MEELRILLEKYLAKSSKHVYKIGEDSYREFEYNPDNMEIIIYDYFNGKKQVRETNYISFYNSKWCYCNNAKNFLDTVVKYRMFSEKYEYGTKISCIKKKKFMKILDIKK